MSSAVFRGQTKRVSVGERGGERGWEISKQAKTHL